MSESTVIVAARLDERDFELARFAIPELAAFHDYEDWLDFRLGSIWGLEMAGFTVETIPVDLTAFIAWRRMTSAHLTVAALDRFARISELRNYEENGLQV